MDQQIIDRPESEEILEAIKAVNKRGWTIDTGIWFNISEKSMCSLSAYILRKYAKEFNNFRDKDETTEMALCDFAIKHFGDDWVDAFILMHDLEDGFLHKREFRSKLAALVNAANRHLDMMDSNAENRDIYGSKYQDVKNLEIALEELFPYLDYDFDIGEYA